MKNVEETENTNFFKWLKEKWADKRNRSWIMLGGYFIFFLILGMAIRTAPDTEETITNNEPELEQSQGQESENSPIIKKLEILSKQDYQYTLYYEEEVLIGVVSNGTNSFTYRDGKYVFLYDKIYKDNDSSLEVVENFLDSVIPIEKITISNILVSVKDSELEYQTETEDEFQVLYYISGEEFIEMPEEEMLIRITGSNDIIEKIELNYLSNYYMLEFIKEG